MICVNESDVQNINVEAVWNDSDDKELLMHTVHVYPAKFPAFIATKAFSYAENEGVHIEKVADIFCGCGTVALEAKVHGKNFWGCDINPVATLIAKTKSTAYNPASLKNYYEAISKKYQDTIIDYCIYDYANVRLKYWFTKNSYLELYKLKSLIENEVPEGIYKDAFLCLFSSILKSSSRWLTKSIKPQIDPNKEEKSVWEVFRKHYTKFFRAVCEISELNIDNSEMPNVEIHNCNFLEMDDLPQVDLIISSPPYVTSYEYADLHQLSTLWLKYADDYRELRHGSIGSTYNVECPVNIELLNDVGKQILQQLQSKKGDVAKNRAVARYYVDIQHAVRKCAGMIKDGGMVFFVVGDTEFKGVQLLNSKHLIQSLREEGFTDIKAAKRKISKKLLTPYRNAAGKFSADKNSRTIYHEEYIITGRMWRQ